MKVFIPTAGLGSRLWPLTRKLNKCLLTVDNKPVISHIIDCYPKSTKFVIAVGFDSKKVIDYLQIAHPNTKIRIVKIGKFKGPGSGLKYTLLKSKKYLQEPFIFHACDTLIKKNKISVNKNWLGISKISKDINYRKVKIKNKKVLSFIEKNTTNSLNLYIGLAGIKDFDLFWKSLIESKKNIGEICGLKSLIKKKIFTKKYDWLDTGSLECLSNYKNNKKNYKINVLEKDGEAIWFVRNRVVKYSLDKTFIKNRIYRQKILKKFTPSIIDFKNNYYSYKLIKGEIISKNIDEKIFKSLLNYLENFWNYPLKLSIDREKFMNQCNNFYKKKTSARVKKILKLYPELDNEKLINGVKVRKIKDIINDIDWKNLSEGLQKNFHGDLHFENILLSRKKNFVLLDWRQDFDKNKISGDLYYDLAKLLHGMIINHQFVVKGFYKIKIKENKENLILPISKRYKKIINFFEEWIKGNGYSLDKIKILTALIFLNIAPLHHKPYSHFLFKLSKLLLENKNYFNKLYK